MKYFDLETNYSTYYDCYFQIAKYAANEETAIRIANGSAAIATITVCIPDVGLSKDMTILDTNNCPWVLDFMEKNGFASDTELRAESGYCKYPIVLLNMEKIKEYGEGM